MNDSLPDIDPSDLRQMRKWGRVRLINLAEAMGLSVGQLHALEHGQAQWTQELVDKYIESLVRLTT